MYSINDKVMSSTIANQKNENNEEYMSDNDDTFTDHLIPLSKGGAGEKKGSSGWQKAGTYLVVNIFIILLITSFFLWIKLFGKMRGRMALYSRYILKPPKLNKYH